MTLGQAGYNRLQIIMHWAVAVTLFAAFVIGDDLGRVASAHAASGAGYFENAPLHVWLGTIAFALILLRIPVRLAFGAPAPEAAPYPWAEAAAIWGHRALYALMILAPLAGVIDWTASIRGMGDIHAILSNWLMALALVHALAALLHHYLWHDGTLRRMLHPQT